MFKLHVVLPTWIPAYSGLLVNQSHWLSPLHSPTRRPYLREAVILQFGVDSQVWCWWGILYGQMTQSLRYLLFISSKNLLSYAAMPAELKAWVVLVYCPSLTKLLHLLSINVLFWHWFRIGLIFLLPWLGLPVLKIWLICKSLWLYLASTSLFSL